MCASTCASRSYGAGASSTGRCASGRTRQSEPKNPGTQLENAKKVARRCASQVQFAPNSPYFFISYLYNFKQFIQKTVGTFDLITFLSALHARSGLGCPVDGHPMNAIHWMLSIGGYPPHPTGYHWDALLWMLSSETQSNWTLSTSIH